MTKTQRLTRLAAGSRRKTSSVQEDLETLQDHLAILDARKKNAGKRTYSETEVRAMLNLPAK